MSVFASVIEYLTHRATVCRELASYVAAQHETDPMFASAAEYEAAADAAILAVRVLMREEGADAIGGAS